MTVATTGAFALGEYSEGVAVMLFYQIGEWFQSYAVSRSRQSITALMDIRPDYANVERDGKLVQVDPDEVAVGEIITVKPGERVPIDGKSSAGAARSIPQPLPANRCRARLKKAWKSSAAALTRPAY